MKVKRFHQLVHLQKGPVNTAILDFLKGSLFQVKNEWLDSYMNPNGGGNGIPRETVIKELEAEDLLIEVPENTWIPSPDLDPVDPIDIQIILEIEDGTDIELVREKFQGIPVAAVHDYRSKESGEDIPFAPMIKKETVFEQCLHQASITGTFNHFHERSFGFNRVLNPCWGKKIAVTGDNQVRPCIMSQIKVGSLQEIPMNVLYEKLESYWKITKDRIDKCRDCELRYICFDCREIAWRQNNNLLAANPLCKYDPYTGTWRDA